MNITNKRVFWYSFSVSLVAFLTFEFGEGKAVFYQNGSWEYSALTGNYGMNKKKEWWS